MIKTDEQLIEEYKHAKYMEAQCNTGQMVAKVLINSLKSWGPFNSDIKVNRV